MGRAPRPPPTARFGPSRHDDRPRALAAPGRAATFAWLCVVGGVGWVTALTGCLPTATYECTADESCGADRTCQPTGYCSVDDPACPSGQRYHDSAPGHLAGHCVAAGPDAGLPDGAAGCPRSPCLEGPPLAAGCACAQDVCALDPYCCTSAWDLACTRRAETVCGAACSGYLAVACGTEINTQASRVYRMASPSLFVPVFVTATLRRATMPAWGDFDGDGDPDLAIAAIYGDLPALYENGVSDVFSSTGDIAAGTNATSLAWGDFDGDLDLDLVVANYDQPSHVLRNDGGAFVVAFSTAGDEHAQSVAWVDYDGDLDLDFFIASTTNGANRLYRNDGGGTFSVDVRFPDIAESSWIAAWADHDHDGDRDVVIGNLGAPNRLYRNTGGVFTEIWSSADAEMTRGAAWGDYDRDGDLDLAFANDGAPARILRNDGADTFTEIWSTPTALTAWSVAWGDVDGDGKLDLAIGARDHPARIYRQLADSMFSLVWTADESDIGAGVAFAPAE